MIRMKAKTVDRTAAVKKKAATGNFRSLGHAGATIRTIARRSIRRRKRPSSPGSPPSTQTGHLKRTILYEVDRGRFAVHIGPVNKYAKTVWDLHEFGGIRKPTRKTLLMKRHRVGDFGPVRKGRMDTKITKTGKIKKTLYADKFQRIRIRTKDQARRADRLIQAENKKRAAEAAKPVRYEKRPFMGPAMDTALPRIPRSWRRMLT